MILPPLYALLIPKIDFDFILFFQAYTLHSNANQVNVLWKFNAIFFVESFLKSYAYMTSYMR